MYTVSVKVYVLNMRRGVKWDWLSQAFTQYVLTHAGLANPECTQACVNDKSCGNNVKSPMG